MTFPRRVILRVRNKQGLTQAVGNTLLRPRRTETVEFKTPGELKSALFLERNGKLEFIQPVPQDILEFLNVPASPAPVVPVSTSAAPKPTPTPAPAPTFSGKYEDLKNKPTIPTKTSQLTDDKGFISSKTVKGIQVLGFDEYDALPESKNTDNILYLVKEDA